MLEVEGNLWDPKFNPCWRCITTNGTLNKKGEAVLGKGCALEARQRYPRLHILLGGLIQKNGNVLQTFPDMKLITFPVKDHWKSRASMGLIKESCIHLRNLIDMGYFEGSVILLPRPGCGAGGLLWEDVKIEIGDMLPDMVIAIHHISSSQKTTPRDCLKCGDEFKSEGKFNRICSSCREVNKNVADIWGGATEVSSLTGKRGGV